MGQLGPATCSSICVAGLFVLGSSFFPFAIVDGCALSEQRFKISKIACGWGTSLARSASFSVTVLQ
jgi:hypothetical protein